MNERTGFLDPRNMVRTFDTIDNEGTDVLGLCSFNLILTLRLLMSYIYIYIWSTYS